MVTRPNEIQKQANYPMISNTKAVTLLILNEAQAQADFLKVS